MVLKLCANGHSIYAASIGEAVEKELFVNIEQIEGNPYDLRSTVTNTPKNIKV